MRPFAPALFLALGACSASHAGPDAPLADAAAPETHALAMSDVSILLPRPADVHAPVLATMAGVDGHHLVWDGLFYGLVVARADMASKQGPAIAFEDMQLVAIRFDLCDRSLIGPCHDDAEGRLRLVFQPFFVGNDGTVQAEDIAVHAFYPIPNADLPSVVQELRALARIQDAPGAGPLGVSPAAAAGNTVYLDRLRALVLHYATEDKLQRLTTIGQEADSAAFAWIFRGFDRDPATNEFASIPIPQVNATKQVTRVFGGDAVYDTAPFADLPTGLALAVNGEVFGTSSRDQQLAALTALVEVQNPTRHDAIDTQCVACHVSTYLIKHRAATLQLDPATLPGAYATSHDVAVESIADQDPRVVRAFGWVSGVPSISQRVANDTAQVLIEIDARYPGSGR